MIWGYAGEDLMDEKVDLWDYAMIDIVSKDDCWIGAHCDELSLSKLVWRLTKIWNVGNSFVVVNRVNTYYTLCKRLSQ